MKITKTKLLSLIGCSLLLFNSMFIYANTTNDNKISKNKIVNASNNFPIAENKFTKTCKYNNNLLILRLKTNESQIEGYQHIKEKLILKKYFTMLFTMNDNAKQIVFHMNNVHTNLYAFQYDQNGELFNIVKMYKDIKQYENNKVKTNYYFLNDNIKSQFITNRRVKYILEVPFLNDTDLNINKNVISLNYNNKNYKIPYNVKDIDC